MLQVVPEERGKPRAAHTKTARNEQLRAVFAVYYILGELWKPYPFCGIPLLLKACGYYTI